MKQFYSLGLIVLLFLIPLRSLSQTTTIAYHYDNAGNLTEKVIILRGGLKSTKISNNDKNPLLPIDTVSSKEPIKDDSFQNQEVRIYPNPTKGIIEIELPNNSVDNSQFQFTVLDMNGRIIIDKYKEPSRISLDLSDQPGGVYFLHIRNGNVVSKWKIIKQ